MALANSSVHEADGMDKAGGYIKSIPIATHDTPNATFLFRNTTNYQLDHHQQQQQLPQSLINFKCGIDNIFHKNNESLLSFEPQGVGQDTYNWDDHQRLMEDPNCFQTATNGYSSPKENKNGDGSVYDWLYSEASGVSDAIQEAEGAHEIANQKRPHMVLNFKVLTFSLQQVLNFFFVFVEKCEISYPIGEENKTFFIRVWKPLLSRRVLKTLKKSPKGKIKEDNIY